MGQIFWWLVGGLQLPCRLSWPHAVVGLRCSQALTEVGAHHALASRAAWLGHAQEMTGGSPAPKYVLLVVRYAEKSSHQIQIAGIRAKLS